MRRSAVTLLLLVCVACTPHEKDDLANERPRRTQATATTPSTGTNVTPAQERNPANQIGGSAAATQGVQLIEYQIRMPQTLRAGSQTLTIANGGKEQHSFEIEGNGVHAGIKPLSRGDSTTLTVDLPPGTYEVYCPVDGHKGKGMTATVVVQ